MIISYNKKKYIYINIMHKINFLLGYNNYKRSQNNKMYVHETEKCPFLSH